MGSAAEATWGWQCILHSPANVGHCNNAFLMQILVWAALVSILGLPSVDLHSSAQPVFARAPWKELCANKLSPAACTLFKVLSAIPEAKASHLMLISPLATWGPFTMRTIEEAVMPLILWMDGWSLLLPKGFSAPHANVALTLQHFLWLSNL